MGEEHSSTEWTLRTFLVELISTTASIVMLVIDIGLDLKLASGYLCNGETLNFGLTLSLVILPSCVIQFYSYAWFASDVRHRTAAWQQMCEHVPHFQAVTTNKRLLVLVHVLQMGLFMRGICLICLGIKALCRHKLHGTWELLESWSHHQADLTMLRMFETMLESAPQLLLQGHIVLLFRQPTVLQCLSIACSIIAIGWSLLDYHIILRNSLEDKNKLKCASIACLVFLLSKYFLLVSQLLTLCLFTLLWPWLYVLSYGVVIWLLMTLTVCLYETNFMDNRCQEFVYRCTVGVILVFSYFNVKDDSTRWSVALYYTIIVIETVTVAGETIARHHDTLLTTEIWILAILVVIAAAFVIGILCMGAYYVFLHPTRGNRHRARESKSSEGSTEGYDEVDAGCCSTAADDPSSELETDGKALASAVNSVELDSLTPPQSLKNGRNGSKSNGTRAGDETAPRGNAAPPRHGSRLERCIGL